MATPRIWPHSAGWWSEPVWSSGGASAINQVIERETDGLMRRTRLRPLPDGRLSTIEGLAFAAILSVLGLLVLAAGVNLLSAAVALATLASYAVVYTPLKRRTSFATVIGAIPGALPPVIGWAAAENALSQGAWVLFGIVFLWQLPHFLAIAWIYREDYARAGLPMLPVIEPDGRSTARQAVVYTAALLPRGARPDARRHVRYGLFRRRADRHAAVSRSLDAVRDDSRGAGRAAAVLHVDHLPSGALGADDRRPHRRSWLGHILRNAARGRQPYAGSCPSDGLSVSDSRSSTRRSTGSRRCSCRRLRASASGGSPRIVRR